MLKDAYYDMQRCYFAHRATVYGNRQDSRDKFHLKSVAQALDVTALQLGPPLGVGSLHFLGRWQRELLVHEQGEPAALGFLRWEHASQQLQQPDERQGRVG